MAFQIKRYYGAAQHQKQGGTETRKLPPLENDGLVGGAGPLGWVAGGGVKAGIGIVKSAWNFLKSTPNQAIRSVIKGTSSSTKTTGLSQNAMAGKDMAKSLNNSPFNPAQKVEAMNLLKKLKPTKPVNFKGPNPMHKTGAGGNSYPGARGDGSMMNRNI